MITFSSKKTIWICSKIDFHAIKHNFLTIGFAYEDQKVNNVVHDDLDQKLNYILTEKQLYKILWKLFLLEI